MAGGTECAEAAAALGAEPRRVFLTIGRLQLAAFAAAPQHAYLIRCIDPPEPIPDLPHSRLLLARGPYTEAAEADLLQRERIALLVSKNSGGSATYGKIAAARQLGLKIIMIAPPPAPGLAPIFEVSAVLDWLEAHRAASP
ncbi:precorrin-6A/cobalt-precorrin-6A reductase [Elstera litoralis]|uniref:precorrin-6A/cobalt-precorrin-6A reductase n=1 Tax=Elstera litoralis TaxID=552518 RepID=UPI000A04844E|nr:precorrin-6A/cobalt-precorrin-6A reductase [Elstera litoralis]